jgi:hypothetical protein
MAGACLHTSQRRIGLGTLHLFYWLLQSCIAGHAPLLPTSSISLASRNGSGAGHILCSFRPWMGMGIVTLAVYAHERVQGSVVSTRTRHLLSACCPHNPSIALSAPTSSFFLFTLLHREHLLLILTCSPSSVVRDE